MRWPIFTSVLLAALMPLPAMAQAYQCRMPQRLALPPAIQKPADEPVRRRPISGYVLALSWSPEFCRSRNAAAQHPFQCSRSYGEFGFIVHGLWPQGDDRGALQWCPTPRPRLTQEALRRHLCMTPSPRLLAHEWQKHGSCMSRDADRYFSTAAGLFNALQFPAMERLSRGPLTHGMLKQELVRANPGLKRESILLKVNRRGWLEEVRLCLDRRFRSQACPWGNGGARGDTRLRIWRGL